MADTKSPIRVEVSHKTVVFTVSFLIGIWILFQIRDIIILVFLSIIFLSALLKPVEWLSLRGLPRVLSVLIVFVLVIALISLAFSIIVPPLISQTSEFVSRLPKIISTVNNFLIFNKISVENLSEIIARQIQQIAGNLVSISTAIFSSVFLLVTFFVLTFYLLLEWRSLVRIIASPFSGKGEKLVANLTAQIEKGLGQWVRGQITLSLIVGVLTYIGLTLLGIPFAVPLALVAGILEIVPIVGPTVASIPAILVGLTISPIIGLAVAALFIIIQQLENNLIVPMVMSKVVGLQPPVIIVALLIGTKLAGIAGTILAVPILVVAKIIIREILSESQNLDVDMKEQ